MPWLGVSRTHQSRIGRTVAHRDGSPAQQAVLKRALPVPAALRQKGPFASSQATTCSRPRASRHPPDLAAMASTFPEHASGAAKADDLILGHPDSVNQLFAPSGPSTYSRLRLSKALATTSSARVHVILPRLRRHYRCLRTPLTRNQMASLHICNSFARLCIRPQPHPISRHLIAHHQLDCHRRAHPSLACCLM